jgi:hypothetical protein
LYLNNWLINVDQNYDAAQSSLPYPRSDKDVSKVKLSDHHGEHVQNGAERVLEVLVLAAQDVKAKAESNDGAGVEQKELEHVLADLDDHVDVNSARGQLPQQQGKVEPGRKEGEGGQVDVDAEKGREGKVCFMRRSVVLCGSNSFRRGFSPMPF